MLCGARLPPVKPNLTTPPAYRDCFIPAPIAQSTSNGNMLTGFSVNLPRCTESWEAKQYLIILCFSTNLQNQQISPGWKSRQNALPSSPSSVDSLVSRKGWVHMQLLSARVFLSFCSHPPIFTRLAGAVQELYPSAKHN